LSIIKECPDARAIAPPDPPSPTITLINGTFNLKFARMQSASAYDCPRSSEPLFAAAPFVSINVIIGKLNLEARSNNRETLRYPSGCAMPKLFLMRSSMSLPLLWPTIATGIPSNLPSPQIRAVSSLNVRSPAIGTKSVINLLI